MTISQYANLPAIEPPAEWGWKADPRTANLPLMEAWDCIFMVSAYCIFVVVSKPLMRGIAPFDLYTLRIVHNAVMVVLSAYMCFQLTINTVSEHGLQLWNLPIQYHERGNAV